MYMGMYNNRFFSYVQFVVAYNLPDRIYNNAQHTTISQLVQCVEYNYVCTMEDVCWKRGNHLYSRTSRPWLV